jgi:large subunit ribosomal protein L22
MEITAKLKNYRIAPRKMRLMADLIRGKNVNEAKKNLMFSSKKSASSLTKLLNSAIANAKTNFAVKEEELGDLYIKKIMVNEGPKMKRFKPIARGSAHEFFKRTSHVLITLDKKENKSGKVVKETKADTKKNNKPKAEKKTK